MTNWHNEATDRLCAALLHLKTTEECYDFLEDICTVKEVQDISPDPVSQRIRILIEDTRELLQGYQRERE